MKKLFAVLALAGTVSLAVAQNTPKAAPKEAPKKECKKGDKCCKKGDKKDKKDSCCSKK